MMIHWHRKQHIKPFVVDIDSSCSPYITSCNCNLTTVSGNHLSTPSIAFQHHLPVSLILQIALKSMNNQTQLQLRGLICTWIRKRYGFSCQTNIMDIQSTTSSDLQHVKNHEILLLSQPDDSILFAQCLLGQGIHELIHSPTQGSRSRAPFCEC